MERRWKYFFVLTLLTSVFSACRQDQYYLFNDEARLQFGPDPSRIYQTSYNLADTLKPYTFYYEGEEVLQDTVFFDIYAIGGTTPSDRSFTLEQEILPSVENAVPNQHYKAFDNPEVSRHYVIKANQVHAAVPIVVLRNPSLKETTVSLKLKIIADDNFLEGERSNLWRKVVLTDRLSQPAAWNASAVQYYYGKYSVTKHAFMIEATGEKWDQEFMSGLTSDYALLQYWIGVLKIALVNYNNANPDTPLTDEFEELVVFP